MRPLRSPVEKAVGALLLLLLLLVDGGASLPSTKSTPDSRPHADAPDSLETPHLDTGYSKVLVLGERGTLVSDLAPNALPRGAEGARRGADLSDDDDDDDGGSAQAEVGPHMSAKESLTKFMRQHVHAAPSSGQPMAARVAADVTGGGASAQPMREEEISSLVKSRLSHFVREYMGQLLKADIQEVRVEQRSNDLRAYADS